MRVAKAQTPFTQGNLVITRVGDGIVSLSSKAAPIALVELTPTGTIVQTVELPFKDEELTTTAFSLNRTMLSTPS
ncbi:MAG: hypothetical protein ACK4HE_11990 [Chitinophagaceae bacterium]